MIRKDPNCNRFDKKSLDSSYTQTYLIAFGIKTIGNKIRYQNNPTKYIFRSSASL